MEKKAAEWHRREHYAVRRADVIADVGHAEVVDPVPGLVDKTSLIPYVRVEVGYHA